MSTRRRWVLWCGGALLILYPVGARAGEGADAELGAISGRRAVAASCKAKRSRAAAPRAKRSRKPGRTAARKGVTPRTREMARAEAAEWEARKVRAAVGRLGAAIGRRAKHAAGALQRAASWLGGQVKGVGDWWRKQRTKPGVSGAKKGPPDFAGARAKVSGGRGAPKAVVDQAPRDDCVKEYSDLLSRTTTTNPFGVEKITPGILPHARKWLDECQRTGRWLGRRR